MAIQYRSDQQLYTGRGPLDAKSLVKTYAELLSIDTWTKDGALVAYNGMLVAVWLDKDENKNLSSNNGIYYLFDPNVTSAVKKPDVTNVNNWYKISDVGNLPEKLAAIDARITAIENSVPEAQINFAERSQFPTVGELSKLYISLDEKKSYIWDGDQYIQVGGSSELAIEVINGGTASIDR